MWAKNFQLTSLERFLLWAFFLVMVAQVAVLAGVRGEGKEKTDQPTWEQEEELAREKVGGTALFDREHLKSVVRENPSLRWKIEVAALGSLILLFGSLAGGIWILVRLVQHRPVAPALGSPGPPTWGFREIFRLVLGVLVLVELVGLLQWMAVNVWSIAASDRNITALVNTLLIDAIIMGGACWIFLRGGQMVFAPKFWPHFRYGIFSYVTYLPVMALLILGVTVLVQLLDHDPAPQPIFTLYFSEERAPVLTGMLILITVAGPIAEELFFRGLLFGWLRHRIGITKGLLLSTFLFAAIHAHPVSFIPIFALGCLFGWLYEKTGSLIAPMTAHILHNVGMLFLASLVKAIALAT